MADNYTFLGATGIDLLIGGGKTAPGRMVSARAEPSGFMFTIPVGAEAFEPQKLGLILSGVADALNTDAAVPGVTDVNVYQDVNNSGQFVGKAAVGVVSTSGNSDESLTLPYGAIFDHRFSDAVGKAVANMDAAEAL